MKYKFIQWWSLSLTSVLQTRDDIDGVDWRWHKRISRIGPPPLPITYESMTHNLPVNPLFIYLFFFSFFVFPFSHVLRYNRDIDIDRVVKHLLRNFGRDGVGWWRFLFIMLFVFQFYMLILLPIDRLELCLWGKGLWSESLHLIGQI